MAELHSRDQILAAYNDKKAYPEDGAECFLEVLVDIRDQLKWIADVLKDAVYTNGNIGVHIE